MPASFEFLRGVIGVIGIGCTFMAGRSMVAMRKGWIKPPRFYGWVFRALICLFAVGIRHSLDIEDIAIWALALLAFGIAAWNMSRSKPPEDLTNTIFPDQS